MPVLLHSRPVVHLRRHGVAYTALVVAISFSPAPSMAANLVTTREIKTGAVTAPKLAPNSVNTTKIRNSTIVSADIKDGSVQTNDLNPSARGAQVIRYDLGSQNFVPTFLSRQLPGTWNAATVAASSWQVTMHSDTASRDYVVPGLGQGGATNYRLSVGPTGIVYIDRTGTGETYSDIRLFRTVLTSTKTVTPKTGSRVAKSSAGGSDR